MKVLLVDDQILFRETVALFLDALMENVQVVQAGSCDEALNVLDRLTARDLILMEIHLPGSSGNTGIGLIRGRFPSVPVVGLSSCIQQEMILRAIDAGAMGYIPKSSSAEALRAALQFVMSKGIYLPDVFFNYKGGAPSLIGDATTLPAHVGVTPADIGLTPQQSIVLFLLLLGKSTEAICRDLSLSSRSVKIHTSVALRALNATTRTQAVMAAGRLGLRFEDRFAEYLVDASLKYRISQKDKQKG
jgi:DNA-binding NarL/FixJ family response regulator